MSLLCFHDVKWAYSSFSRSTALIITYCLTGPTSHMNWLLPDVSLYYALYSFNGFFLFRTNWHEMPRVHTCTYQILKRETEHIRQSGDQESVSNTSSRIIKNSSFLPSQDESSLWRLYKGQIDFYRTCGDHFHLVRLPSISFSLLFSQSIMDFSCEKELLIT